MSNPKTKTKVVATLGPSSSTPEMIEQLIDAGVDVFRLNFSHGSHEDHGQTIGYIHTANEKLGTNTAILADLQGPKIRLGVIKEPFELETGDTIVFTSEEIDGTKDKVPVSYKGLAKDLKVGETVKVDDGKIELVVEQILNKKEVKLKTVYGGVVKQKKGMNLPNTLISIPTLTEKDIKDLEFILQKSVSWIALSFVRSSSDIIKLRGMLEFKSHKAKIVAKIEKPEALKDLDAIIDASDAVMVARGDLGVEIPVEEVPTVQKMIVNKCIADSKPVIIATQMMESMIEQAIPTRAEITDVANAILDGADAVMLSGETAVGKHPAKVVQTMQRILEKSEEDFRIYNRIHHLDQSSSNFLSNAICYKSISIADEVGAKAIVATTKSGHTAFALASYRPKAKIYAFTENEDLLNTLNLLWGVRAFYYDKYDEFSESNQTIADLHQILKEKGLLEKGDIVLNTGSIPIIERGPTNFIKLSVI